MKEIKFRIWNGTEMIYDIVAGKFGTFYVNPENGDGLNPEDSASLSVNTTKYPDDIPLMQYTGLIDKNKKCIYDGDILITETGKTMIVKWNEKFASWCLYRDGWAFYHWFGESCEPKDCEVIGNKYQNQELLSEII
ncbi:MAG TPA: YopX family protein [Candidatus Paceibacterota bacterium]|nr:YopX family protein [Candidatus Paceibacterota bacterium]